MLPTLALLAALALPPADTVAGTWKITGDVAGNPLNETCTIKQTGATLTGSCLGAEGVAWEVTGEMKDGKVVFKHGGNYQGQVLTITYTGTLASPKELKGTVDVDPFNVSGTFSAAAAPAAPTPAKP